MSIKLIASYDVGTFVGFPGVDPATRHRNAKVARKEAKFKLLFIRTNELLVIKIIS